MKDQNLAFIDVETTGTNPDKHEIIELALILCKQVQREGKGPKLDIISKHNWKIKMQRPDMAEDEALRINHYNEVDWMFAVDRRAAMEEFAKLSQGAAFVSHNLTFDYAFVMKAFEETAVENKMYFGKLDTISIAYARLYDIERVDKFSLRSLCELFKVENSKAHSALADTEALVEVYKKMMGISNV